MNLKIDDELYGFKVLDIAPVEDLNGTGFWLVHLQTGMQVFYVDCDDSENLFNFTFSTPSADSTGVAHAIEHSVLCGSRHFPLKSPFLQLNKQSITTFLNALTSSDTTMYPASSTVEAEYFNVMKVYGDAVFFPRLEKWTFEQEVRRMEADDNGDFSVQGVVYNEMKGAYNDFNRTYFKQLYKTFLSPTFYAGDSGGDPKSILKLSYEDFLKFHKTYYRPSNCKIFLYGNIALEKQLAFIDENFVRNFDSFQLEPAEIAGNFENGENNAVIWDYLSELKNSSLLGGDNRPYKNAKIMSQETAQPAQELQKTQSVQSAREEPAEEENTDTRQKARNVGRFLKPASCEISNLCKPPKYVTLNGPDATCSKPSVICNWLIGTRSQGLAAFYESSFLVELLMGFDASPLRKVLTHCKLGSGMDTDKSTGINYLPYMFFCVGVGEVEEKDQPKVEKLIWDTLRQVAEDGFDDDLVEMSLLDSDFSVREVSVGSSNPLSLSRICLWGWNNGFTPFDFLHATAAFEEIKRRIRSDKNYLKNLVKKCLIDNPYYSCITYVPSPNFKAEIEKAEKSYIDSFLQGKNHKQKEEFLAQVRAEQKKLHDFQQQKESDELLALIPHVKPGDLTPDEEDFTAERKKIGNIEVFNFKTFTNGLVYFDLMLPFDVLDLEDLQFMQALQNALLFAGYNGVNWEISCKKRFLSCADFDVSFSCTKQNDFISEKAVEERQKTEPWFARDMICWHVETTNEKIAEALDCLFLNVLHPNYDEFSRIEDTFFNKKSQILDDFITSGHKSAITRAAARLSKTSARRDLIYGFSQYFNVYAEEKEITVYCKKLEEIYGKILKSGACVFFTSDETEIDSIYGQINKYAGNFGPMALPKKMPEELYYEFARNALPPKNITEGREEFENMEYFTANMQGGFSASSLNLSFLTEEKCVALICLLQWFSGDFLWERIRTVGGAYGCHSSANLKNRLINFYSYRDPSPLQSLQVYKNALKELAAVKFSTDTVHRCIAAFYSNFTGTLSVSDKGGRAAAKVFSGVETAEIEEKKRILLGLTPEDFEQMAKKLSEYVENHFEDFSDVIISAKNENFSGKTVQLAL